MNRLYALMAVCKAGLTNYVYEWWHFSWQDRYAAYWVAYVMNEPDRQMKILGRASVPACYGICDDDLFFSPLAMF